MTRVKINTRVCARDISTSSTSVSCTTLTFKVRIGEGYQHANQHQKCSKSALRIQKSPKVRIRTVILRIFVGSRTPHFSPAAALRNFRRRPHSAFFPSASALRIFRRQPHYAFFAVVRAPLAPALRVYTPLLHAYTLSEYIKTQPATEILKGSACH